MAVKNAMEVAESAHGKINPRYDLTQKNWEDIVVSSGNVFEAVKNGFLFGYMQGMKAAREKKEVNIV